MFVKTEIAQNDTDLSCIKLDINVSKCFTKAQHFESHAATAIARPPTSTEYNLKFLYLTLISITTVGHQGGFLTNKRSLFYASNYEPRKI